jgi:prepilin peptidase CpaA
MMPVWGLIGLAAIGLVGSWLDATQRRLPNWLSALGLLAGLAVSFATGGLDAVGSHGLHALVALLGGMALFALGVIGGGDAKFYAGLAAWFPLSLGLNLFVAVAMAGAGLLLIWAAIRKLRGQAVFTRNAGPNDGLPYGVAVSAGAMLVAVVPMITR